MPKKNIHPTYHFVIFRDVTTGKEQLTRSTCTGKEKKKWTDNKEYPLILVAESSDSHPFYTGKINLTNKKGRIKMFNDRYKGFAK